MSRGSGYKLTWRGSTVLREIDESIDSAMRDLQSDILNYLQTNLHRYTGQMADEAFAELTVESGKRRVLRVGSDAPHTIFHELRYHPQLREALDEWAPKVSAYIRQALR